MRRFSRTPALVAGLTVLALGVAACGSDDDDNGGGGEGTPAAKGKQGGTLISIWKGDVDYIDPGQTYYVAGSNIMRATQRSLMTSKPDDADSPVPDLAAAEPEISADKRTVTVEIKRGIKFSPPVNREVKAKDVKYAIERGFFKSVANGYAGPYFGDIVGAKEGVKPGTELEGITTPDPYSLEFKLSKPTGANLVAAFGRSLTAPVPEEYARKYDKETTSTYGEHQVATGPYMIENNGKATASGYKPGRSITLVRNPSWDKSTDTKPAYVDRIEIRQGNQDTTVAANKILQGKSMVSGEWSPTPQILKKALTRFDDQIALTPSGGIRFISMNTAMEPFDDINVRKAVIAGFNREALRLTRGGEAIGPIASHVIPPGMAGFEEAGGEQGFGLDYLSKPAGDMALAAEYFKKAGYESGKYEGDKPILLVGDTEGIAQKAAEVAKQNFEQLGFKVKLRLVAHDAMYTNFCNVPSKNIEVCTNVGWVKDFADPLTMLDPLFHGESIAPSNNANWPQLDVPEVNKAIDEAAQIVDPKERAQAWADADRLVMEQAPVIPWVWDDNPNLSSSNVNMVGDEDSTMPSLTYTSLK